MRAKTNDGFTQKEREFVELYLQGYSGAESIRRSGYSSLYAAQYAHWLLRRPHIQTEIQNRQATTSRELDIDRKKQLEDLENIKDHFVELLELIGKDDPSPSERQRIRDLKSVVSARDMKETIDLQNKLLGLYQPEKIQLDQNITVNFIDDGGNTVNIEGNEEPNRIEDQTDNNNDEEDS